MPEQTVRASVLAEASRIISTERNASYGDPSDDFARQVGAINALFVDKLRAPLTTADIAIIMIVVKLSRLSNAPAYDSWLDICGYAACGAEVSQPPAERVPDAVHVVTWAEASH